MATESEHPPTPLSPRAPAPPTRHRSLRWFQFRLRSLLVVLTLCAVGFALVAASWRQHQKEMRALETLGATGYASSSMDAWYPRLAGKQLDRKHDPMLERVTASVDIPDWLRSVPGLAADGIFGRVTRISIGHRDKIARLTPAEKASLDDLHSLRALAIEGFLLDREDVERMATYADLSHLSLAGCTFDAGAFEAIGLLPGVISLDLNGSSIRDNDLQALVRLKNLRTLYLSHTEITDQGLVHLQTLPALRNVDLSGSRVTDHGVDRLRQAIPSLQLLDD